MARRTKEAIRRDAVAVQKCTERISADVLSAKDLAEKLNLTKKQLRYTFECMESETAERIQAQLKYLSRKTKQFESYKALKFSTRTMLGYNEKHTKLIVIDPSTMNRVLEEGAFTPKRNDVLYIVEHYDRKIFFKKSLVLDVEVKRNCLTVNVLELINQKFPENIRIPEIAVDIWDGMDSYVLSKV